MYMMKPFFILALFLLPLISLSQDILLKKDSTIQKAKILEVSVETIKFKKSELPKGPTYEISKNDVALIIYSNGYEEVYDKNYLVYIKQKNKYEFINDTISYSMLYVVFQYGNDNSSRIPLYFNDKYIWTMRNHNRMEYKIFSQGPLKISRFDGQKTGPIINLLIQHGKSYGIYIEIPYPYAFDPNKRFAFRLVEEEADIHEFLNDYYFGFEPFKDEEKRFVEDKNNPLIDF